MLKKKLLVLSLIVMLGLVITMIFISNSQAQSISDPEAEAIVTQYKLQLKERLMQKLIAEGYTEKDAEKTVAIVSADLEIEVVEATAGNCEALKSLPKADGFKGDKDQNTDTTRAEFAYEYAPNKLCGVTWSNWQGPGIEDFGGLWQVRDQNGNLTKDGSRNFLKKSNNPQVSGPAWDYFEWQMPFGFNQEEYHLLLEVWAWQQPGDRGALPSDYSRVFRIHPFRVYLFAIKQKPRPTPTPTFTPTPTATATPIPGCPNYWAKIYTTVSGEINLSYRRNDVYGSLIIVGGVGQKATFTTRLGGRNGPITKLPLGGSTKLYLGTELVKNYGRQSSIEWWGGVDLKGTQIYTVKSSFTAENGDLCSIEFNLKDPPAVLAGKLQVLNPELEWQEAYRIASEAYKKALEINSDPEAAFRIASEALSLDR